MRAGVHLPLGVARQVRPLGQALAQQPVGVLVAAALPGAIRISKEGLNREPLGQLHPHVRPEPGVHALAGGARADGL